MTISYYIHAWQGLLMFIAGVISVLASFGGYIQSGGGEELLRRALAGLETGKANFDSIDFNWRNGEMIVSNLRHDNFDWPKKNPVVAASGLTAKDMKITMDLFPWPPNVTRVTVEDMPDIAIRVSDGFLQDARLQGLRQKQLPPIEFKNCNLTLKLGEFLPLKLSGCSGELRRDASGTLRGHFSLQKLNGNPFNIKLETLEDGSWVCTGDEIQIDTRGSIVQPFNPLAGKLDPVSLLVGALFSGEMGADGKVTSLRVEVLPAAPGRAFKCHGEVGYQNLEFRLPPPEKPSGVAVPIFLSQLIGHEDLWPRWMQVDKIRTGEKGRVEFHMAEGRLEFHCDEGPGSAFIGIRQDKVFPPLESLRGSVETDADGRPRQIVLHGFLGEQLSFETYIERAPDRIRTYQLMLEPRAGGYNKLAFGRPLWRFSSRVQDYTSVPASELGEHPLVSFELEGSARHFPWTELPAGMRDVGGHVRAQGRFTEGLLRFDSIALDDGAELVYGGASRGGKEVSASSEFGPLWQALQEIFTTTSPWKLHDLSLQGDAQVQFGADRRWESSSLKNWSLASGSIIYGGLTTDLGIAQLSLSAQHRQQSVPPYSSHLEVTASVPELWQVKLSGDWKTEEGKQPDGDFMLVEKNVPLPLHPQREKLTEPYVSADKRRVNRITEVHIHDGKIEHDVKP